MKCKASNQIFYNFPLTTASYEKDKSLFNSLFFLNFAVQDEAKPKGLPKSLFYWCGLMISKEKIESLVQEKLEGTDFFLVELKISADNRINVFLDGMSGVTIDFCVAVSKSIDSNLDRELEDFELEVSSAGIGIPFKVRQQYDKCIGKEVEVLTSAGQKLVGKLAEVNDEGFSVQYEKKVLVEGKKRKQLQEFIDFFAYEDVKSTKEVLKV